VFKCEELVDYLLNNYMCLFPLLSVYFIKSEIVTDLPTSSGIENHWKDVKQFMSRVPLRERDVSVYFALYLSYLNSKMKVFELVGKSKELKKRLSTKRTSTNSDEFKPNYNKRLKKNIVDSDIDEEDGYTKRNLKKEKTCKFVRRRLNFANLENGYLSKQISSVKLKRKKKKTVKGH